MYCSNCGQAVLSKDQFCTNCGETLTAVVPPTSRNESGASIERATPQYNRSNSKAKDSGAVDSFLHDDEEIVRQMTCSFLRKRSWIESQLPVASAMMKYVAIRLYVTTHGRLIHLPTRFNLVNLDPFEIDAQDIADVSPQWHRAMFIPLIPNLIVVKLKDGSSLRYAVTLWNSRKQWIKAIKSAAEGRPC